MQGVVEGCDGESEVVDSFVVGFDVGEKGGFGDVAEEVVDFGGGDAPPDDFVEVLHDARFYPLCRYHHAVDVVDDGVRLHEGTLEVVVDECWVSDGDSSCYDSASWDGEGCECFLQLHQLLYFHAIPGQNYGLQGLH